MRISIFIPSYNVAKFLPNVIGRIPLSCLANINKIWVINDGSTDDTAVVAQKLAHKYHALEVVNFESNQGYGAVIKKGMKLCMDDGSDYAVCLHGDGQYPPESLDHFLPLMEREKLDVLQGSRVASGTALKGGMPVYKYVANRALTTIENFIFGLKQTDYHSGFMFYSRHALESIPYQLLSGSFEIDLEMIAAARARNLKITEQPIPTHYGEETSYLNPITYGFRCLWVMTKYIFGHYD